MNCESPRSRPASGNSPVPPREPPADVPSDAHLRLGRRGERRAARYLKRKGYRILARGYETHAGQIDLICADGATLVFVEVKTRTSDAHQDPAETVRCVQWERIERAARAFLAHPAAVGRPVRFDLVTVLWPTDGRPVIEHHENVHHAAWTR
ncbi:MAG: YraN family protein [Planctomycetota bacterium]|nr:MAG: YraN family protein [Planctomycetota bacterium]